MTTGTPIRTALCEECGQPVPADYEVREGKVYLKKHCPDCGVTSALVSNDAAKWSWKREISDFNEPGETGCSMVCSTCNHQSHTPPYTVAIDLTNRCNQRCPICLANVDAMGFDFNPPLEYFEKIFRHFEGAQPRPNFCFFGGEPTVRADLFDIIRLAKSHGHQVQIFTNGVRLANREFCKELCALGLQLNFGFDGTRSDIYEKLRARDTLEVRKKALENILEFGVNKLVISSTMAEGVNDDNILEMMEYLHSFRERVSVWAFVPLTPCWEQGKVDLQATTTECVERMFEKTVPGIEWVPTGMLKFKILARFFGRQTLGGSHPNCESATLLVSDGQRYRPISDYLKIRLSDLLQTLKRLDKKLEEESATLPESGFRRHLFDVKTFLKTLKILGRAIQFRSMLARPATVNALLAVWDLIRGKKIDRILNERTSFKTVLTLITIPYEDMGGLEDARLKDCPAVFAYEDIDTGRIKTAAFCSWQMIKEEACRKIQEHYSRKEAVGAAPVGA